MLQDYDPAMRPVRDVDQIIEVEVDIIYRQVLDMDEKNQVLSSFVWYRQVGYYYFQKRKYRSNNFITELN